MAPFPYASDSSFEVNLELVSVIMITLHFIYEVIYSKHRRQRNTSASNFMQQQPSTRRHGTGTLTVYNIKQLLKPPVMPVMLTRTEFHQSSQLSLPSEIMQDLSNDACIRAHPASTFSCYLFHVLFCCLFSVSGCLFYLF